VQAHLSYQEFRADDPFSCFLGTIVFLSTQVLVFRALTAAFPEVVDPIWCSRMLLFNNDVASLWQRLKIQFPRQCREAEARSQGMAVPPANLTEEGRSYRAPLAR
jgi:hypothetical protein